MKELKYMFLQNSYNDLKSNYQKILKDKTTSWDIIVLTASNIMQAKTYELQIENRKRQNLLPKNIDYIVIPDLDGKRIGSGGATLNVLAELNKKYDLLTKKVLIINSGGDSKRVPQYSSIGKLFAPIPRELNPHTSSSIFDEIMVLMSSIPNRMDNGVFIMCGDSLILFNPLQVDLQYKQAAVISMKMEKEKGTNHGVFVANNKNIVTEFLHKQPLEILEEKAVENGYINFDTGMIYFNHQIVKKLLDIIIEKEEYELFVSEESCLNIYGDFLYPMAINSTYNQYLKEACENNFNDNLAMCRKKLWNILKDVDLRIVKLSPALFLHFGTSNELLEILTNKIDNYCYLDWNKNIASYNKENNITAINSIVENSSSDGNVYIENSNVINSKIGKNVIISNTIVDNVSIPNNIALSTIILKTGEFVTRIYDISLNPKEIISKESFLFQIKGSKVLEEHIGKSFWKAPIFPVCEDMNSSVRAALNFYKIVKGKAMEEDYDEYNNYKKISFYESFNQADTEKTISATMDLKKSIILKKIISIINEHDNLNKAKELINSFYEKNSIIKELKKQSQIDSMRLNYLLYLISNKNKNKYLTEAFNSIKSTIDIQRKRTEPKFLKDKVEMNSPVRINFGGGWSDTPPYCIENGGTVLNVAVKVNGQYPINVVIEKIKETKIIFSCVDFNDTVEIKNIKEIRNCSNPNDSYALLKCAVIISGLISSDDKTLNDLYERIGGGIKITTNTKAIPRGSGLGTSSILSGTVLKALYEFMDYQITDDEVSYDVLKLEQLMSTGGGWQDQVGGLIKGIKLIKTTSGKAQNLNIKKINQSVSTINELNKRILLINTSQRRLARNLLRDVMGKYICGDETTVEILEKIQALAEKMAKNLELGKIDDFAKQLNEHWELSKLLDIGCTNTCIEFIFESIKDLIVGRFICGAGGGGFLVIVLKEGITKKDVDERINSIFQDSGVATWSIEVEE